MDRLFWYKSRFILLKFCTFALAATLFYIFTKPEKDPFTILSSVDQRWDAIDESPIEFYGESVKGIKYQEKDNHNLIIEVLLMPASNGNSSWLIESHLNFDLQPNEITTIEDKKVGSYALFEQNNSAYLSTCIHPQGRTASDTHQFTGLVNHNLRGRVFSWILGLSDLRDWRCFWVSMSVDLKDIGEEEATKLLQNKLYSIMPENRFK